MAQEIDFQLRIGSTLERTRVCPTVTDSTTPIIAWTIPEEIVQRRINIEIRSLEPGQVGYFLLGETVTSNTYLQYPVGLPMNFNFYGLCSIQLAVSEDPDIGTEFEFTSGIQYFVLDLNAEILFNSDNTYFQWTDSIDPDGTTQSLIYQLQVSRDPLFENPLLEYYDINVPEEESSSFTKYLSNLETGYTYFWRVRSYDGLDWGPWTRTNGFENVVNYAPIITFNSVNPLGNDEGDVIIEFTIEDLDEEPVYIEMFYTGGNAGEERTKMSMLNPLIRVQPGTHTVIWRSGRDEQLISADDYVIYGLPTDSIAPGFEGYFGPFSMDNSTIGLDPGGIGAVDIEFPIFGNFVKLKDDDYKEDGFPLWGYTIPTGLFLDGHISPVLTPYVRPWQHYKRGNLDSDIRSEGSDSRYGFGYYAQFGQYHGLDFTYGMKASLNRNEEPNNLDYLEPDFTLYEEYVNESGWHEKIGELEWGKLQGRYGYVAFTRVFWSDRNQCPDCGGKGWRQEDLIPVSEPPGGYYKRQPCPGCNGSRFNPNDPYWNGVSSSDRMYRWSEVYWVPINEVVTPGDRNFLSLSRIVTPKIAAEKEDFFMGSPESATISRGEYDPSINHQRIAPTIKFSQATKNNNEKTSGVIDWWNIGESSFVKKTYTTQEPDEFPVQGVISHESEIQEQEFPIEGSIRAGKEDYLTGYGPEESRLNINRTSPTHRYAKGIWYLSSSITQIEPLEPLKIIYLQSGWDAYNTIHWQATISSVSRIHLQVAKFFDDGTRTEYYDVITEGAEYFPEINAYLVSPNVWSAYWDIIRKQFTEEGYDYRLRIRQFDTVSKSSSQWIYSSKFVVDRFASNPPNILYSEYDKWRKVLNVTYRIDDSQNEFYDITGAWYSVDGRTFIPINQGDLSGQKYDLSSDITEVSGIANNVHTISWQTSSYNLEPGSKYRFRLEVVPSRITNGVTPPFFRWTKDYNPRLRRAELNLLDIQGQVQYYVYNGDTDQWEYIEGGVAIPGRLDRLEFEKDEIELVPPPSGKWMFYTPQNNTGILTDPEGYQDWLNEDLIPGISRNQVLQEKEDEINELRNKEIPYWGLERDEAEKDIRKYLINQGFYNNGFNNNNPANGIFRFRVESQPGPDSVDLETGQYTPYYSTRFEVYHRVQLDFFDTFDSQVDGHPLRDIMFNQEGDRIQGGARDRLQKTLPAGTSETQGHEYDVEETWKDFGEGEGQPWDTELREDTEGGFLGEQAEVESSDEEIPYVTYTIEKSLLPGERFAYFKNYSYPSVDDILPSGISSFSDESYYWRTASYNIVDGPTKEVPIPTITSIGLYQPVNKMSLSYTLFGDEQLSTASITSMEYSLETKSPAWEQDVEISFPTDRPVGYEMQDEGNPTIHVPYGLDRSRPSVILTEDHQFMLWYSKKNAYSEDTIFGARGKSWGEFGEYENIFPRQGNRTLFSFNGALGIHSPSVILDNGLYTMYATMLKDGSNKIIVSTSTDAENWSEPSVIEGIPSGSYSPCILKDSQYYHIWFCQSLTTSEIYYARSTDGVNFTMQNSGNAVLTHTYNLNTPWVIESGSGLIMYYTKYDSGGQSTIYSVASNDGITWTEDQQEISTLDSMNPCVIPCYYGGNLEYRIFYNTISGSDVRIRTASKTDRVWKPLPIFTEWSGTNQINHWNIIGDRSGSPSSKFGLEYSIDIILTYQSAELKNSTPEDDVRLRIHMTNDDSTREFLVQSHWIDYNNAEEFSANVEPETYNYNEEVKNMNFGNGFS
jgi:hypothetical protein